MAPAPEDVERLALLDEPLPEKPSDPQSVLRMLDEIGSPATMASAGGRFFGFVMGGSLPAALACNWLAGAWDQDAGMQVASPISAALENISLKWLLDVLQLPAQCGGGFVTGATMANFSGLSAARHAVLQREGWDVEAQGLFGAPPITVIVGDEVHVSVLKALSHLGLGRERVLARAGRRARSHAPGGASGNLRSNHPVPAGREREHGRFRPGRGDHPARPPGWRLGARRWRVRPVGSCCPAPCPPGRRGCRGEFMGYGCAQVAERTLRQRAGVRARGKPPTGGNVCPGCYLMKGDQREPDEYVPELSRRARGVEVWAALSSLGREGLAEMIERTCVHATLFAEGLKAAGYEVLNDVVLNQVLVSFGDDQTTRQVVASVQQDGTCWCGGTFWQGRAAMRISVSSWATTDEDRQCSLEAILRLARQFRQCTR